MSGERRAEVIAVSSHVARGAVGNRAMVFALERLGHAVWSVPTVQLPFHPGHGKGTRIVPDDRAFASMMADLAASPGLGNVGALISGYLGSPAQADPVAELVSRMKAANPAALYLCDPVIGDEAGAYVPGETIAAIRQSLLPLADIATPNRFELELLTGQGAGTVGDAMAAAAHLGVPTVLVTSAPAMMAGSTGVLLVTARQRLMAEHRAVAHPPNGPGDLFAALSLARTLAGESPQEALRKATASAFEALARAAGRQADDLMLAADSDCIVHRMGLVLMRHLAGPDRRA